MSDHAQKVFKLRFIKRVVEGVIIDEVFGVRGDDNVYMICETGC